MAEEIGRHCLGEIPLDASSRLMPLSMYSSLERSVLWNGSWRPASICACLTANKEHFYASVGRAPEHTVVVACVCLCVCVSVCLSHTFLCNG